MSSVVKKSISLEKDLFEKLKAIMESSRKPFSQLICEAAEGLVHDWENSQLEDAYQRYYAQSRPVETALNAGYLKLAKKGPKKKAMTHG